MKKLLAAVMLCFPALALATPSTQIWIPSTDIQKYGSLHLNIDNYVAAEKNSNGAWNAPAFVFGPTIGILPEGKVQAEAGFDYIKYGNTSIDGAPMYLHAKAGTAEGALFAGSPAFALGGYNFGTKKDFTDQNVVYGLAAKNIGKIGRFSAGYYAGNDKVLVDENGDKANTGVLLSWDRSITEISDKLWAAVDYQGGDSSLGALSFGLSWAVSPNTSLILGYDIYNNQDLAGIANTATVQVDINLW
jgi:hypothetical protein